MKRQLPMIVLCSLTVALSTYSMWEVRHVERTANATLAWTSAAQPTIERLWSSRIVELPEDGQAYYTSLFTSQDWRSVPAERQLVAWFESDPRLASLMAQTHSKHYTRADKLYSRYQRAIGDTLPAILIQNAQGKVLYKASGPNIPSGPSQLADQITQCFPRPKPDDTPVPTPTPPLTLPPVPDVGVSVTSGGDDSLWIAAIVGAVFLGLGVAWAWRRESQSF